MQHKRLNVSIPFRCESVAHPYHHLLSRKTATAGGITKRPTSQSATASDMTKQLVTVRRRRVVSTDNMTNVFPITVNTINIQNIEARKPCSRVIGGRPLSSSLGVAVSLDPATDISELLVLLSDNELLLLLLWFPIFGELVLFDVTADKLMTEEDSLSFSASITSSFIEWPSEEALASIVIDLVSSAREIVVGVVTRDIARTGCGSIANVQERIRIIEDHWEILEHPQPPMILSVVKVLVMPVASQLHVDVVVVAFFVLLLLLLILLAPFWW